MDFIAQANLFGTIFLITFSIFGVSGISAFLLDMFRPTSRLLTPTSIVGIFAGVMTLLLAYCLFLINLNI